MTTRLPWGLTLFLSLAFIAGCSADKSAPAKLSGTVTYNGAPVTGGMLAFYSNAGVYPAAIASDGTYTVADVPTGEMVVTVDTEMLNPKIKKQTYTGKNSGGAAGMYGKAAGGSSPAPRGAKQQSSPAPEGAEQPSPGTYVKIPRNYIDKNTSPLKINVERGSQTINLELKD